MTFSLFSLSLSLSLQFFRHIVCSTLCPFDTLSVRHIVCSTLCPSIFCLSTLCPSTLRPTTPPRIPQKPAEAGGSAGSSTAGSAQAGSSGARPAQKQTSSSCPSGQAGKKRKNRKGKAPFSSSSGGSGRSGGKGKGPERSRPDGTTLPLRVWGCLAPHWRRWQAIGAESWVVTVLRDGYRVPFLDSPPPLSRTPVSFPTYRAGSPRA